MLTAGQARQLFQLYKVPVEVVGAEGSPQQDPVVDLVAEGSPREDSGVEADIGEPAPLPLKVAKMFGKKLQQLNVELHPDVGRQIQCFTTFWMQDMNYKRGSPPLAETTVSKSRERLLSKSTIGHAMCMHA